MAYIRSCIKNFLRERDIGSSRFRRSIDGIVLDVVLENFPREREKGSSAFRGSTERHTIRSYIEKFLRHNLRYVFNIRCIFVDLRPFERYNLGSR